MIILIVIPYIPINYEVHKLSGGITGVLLDVWFINNFNRKDRKKFHTTSSFSNVVTIYLHDEE